MAIAIAVVGAGGTRAEDLTTVDTPPEIIAAPPGAGDDTVSEPAASDQLESLAEGAEAVPSSPAPAQVAAPPYVAPPEPPPMPKLPPPPVPGVPVMAEASPRFAVQLAATDLPEEAATIQERYRGRFGDVRIDVSEDAAGRSRYRILTGSFATAREAERFVATANLRGEIPDVWIHRESHRTWDPRLGPPDAGTQAPQPAVPEEAPSPVPVPDPVPDPAPVPLEVSLHCGDLEDEGGRRTRTRVHVNPSNGREDVEVAVRWDCNPKRVSRWSRPTYVSLAPQFLIMSTEGTSGSAGRTAWGLGLTAYKNVGGWGPSVDYRLLQVGTVRRGQLINSPYTTRHEIRVGAAFPFSAKLEVEPRFGLAHTQFLTAGSGENARFREELLPVAALQFRGRLVRWNKGTELHWGTGYEWIFGSTGPAREIYSGSRWNAELRLRSALGDSSEADAYLGYQALSQESTDEGVTEGAWVIGFSVTWQGAP
ncbi:MAG: SPOR domain-containing protein [Bdellovibrionales bacterium]|nr:SPOR domain-containing protein [Bdellovibrionales bacterium]